MGEDVQLALYLSYELHYSDLPGIDPAMEWDVALLACRAELEREFLRSLAERISPEATSDAPIAELVPSLIAHDDGPSLSSFIETEGTIEQMRQFVVHRSAYQLKEADPHTHAIARLGGRAKQLLARIQAGEYGADGHDRRMHAELFAQTMRELDLDDRPHAHLDALPASALMISNLISAFGLNRRWRGALVGHLAVFEMTSVEPMGRYARGLERLGSTPAARRFYDVHVLADAEHEHMALAMATALSQDEPHLTRDIAFGAACAIAVEREFAEGLMRPWQDTAQAWAA